MDKEMKQNEKQTKSHFCFNVLGFSKEEVVLRPPTSIQELSLFNIILSIIEVDAMCSWCQRRWGNIMAKFLTKK